MYSDLLKKFAAELKSNREAKQVTLNYIAAKTRIDIKYLTAIENANFDVLPELYIRAFIKEYAATIDLNSEEIIKKFDHARTGKQEEPEHHANHEEEKTIEPEAVHLQETIHAKPIKNHFDSEEPIPSEIPLEELKKPLDHRIIYAGIGGAVIFIILIIYAIIGSSTTLEKEAASSSQDNIIEKKRFEEVQSPVKAANVPGDSLRLKVVANDKVWFKVTSDQNTPKEFLFAPQQSVVIAAKSKFTLSIGNAGGINLFLNGKQMEPLGKIGEVKSVEIDNAGLKVLKIDRPKNEPTVTKTN